MFLEKKTDYLYPKDNTSVLFSKNVDANIYDKSEETNKYCLDLRSLIIYIENRLISKRLCQSIYITSDIVFLY